MLFLIMQDKLCLSIRILDFLIPWSDMSYNNFRILINIEIGSQKTCLISVEFQALKIIGSKQIKCQQPKAIPRLFQRRSGMFKALSYTCLSND